MKLRHSILGLFAAICLIAGTGYSFYKYQRGAVMKKLLDENRQIRRIVQTGPEKEALKTPYLAELMGLSVDKPTPYDLFQPRVAEKKLRAAPVIKTARVSKKKPDTVFVDYALRQPIASLSDYANTAIDEEGYLFPLRPFFTPKKLPELYLGIDYASPLPQETTALAFTLLRLCDGQLYPLRIDTANAAHKSLGRREVVLIVQAPQGRHTLRLVPHDFEAQLGNYLELRETLSPGDHTIDLRLPHLGFVSADH